MNEASECAWRAEPCYSPAAWGTPLCAGHVIRVAAIARQHEPSEEARASRERDRVARQRAQSVVYYLAQTDGRIKIGTTVNLKQRLSSLRLDQDAVLATEPGEADLEHMRHMQFAHIRGRWETFDDTPQLREHIAMIRSHYGEPSITTYV